MKINGFILLGCFLLVMAGMSAMQIADSTPPSIYTQYCFPKGGNLNYSKIEYLTVGCYDLESGIQQVKFTIWQTGKPATFYYLTKWAMAGYVEWWALNLSTPITEAGTYYFWFIVYNNAGLYKESTYLGSSNVFNIVHEAETPPETPPETEDFGPLPETQTEPSEQTSQTQYGSSGWEIPLIFMAVGGLSIFYGFSQERKKK